MLKQTERRLRTVNKELKQLSLQISGMGLDLHVQRREALREYKDARIESQLHDENMKKRRQHLLAIVRPHLSERRKVEKGAAAGKIARGLHAEPMRDEIFNDRAKSIPRTREGIKNELEHADGLLQLVERRYERLASL